MLVLSRKLNQAIIVRIAGAEIRVLVLSITGEQVRLGIQAPREVPVHREEVQRRIEAKQGDSTER